MKLYTLAAPGFKIKNINLLHNYFIIQLQYAFIMTSQTSYPNDHCEISKQG